MSSSTARCCVGCARSICWWLLTVVTSLGRLSLLSSLFSARKQEIIKMTEQLIEAINNGDFEAYTWVNIWKIFVKTFDQLHRSKSMNLVSYCLDICGLLDHLLLYFPPTGESVTPDWLPLSRKPLETWWREWTFTSSILIIVSTISTFHLSKQSHLSSLNLETL